MKNLFSIFNNFLFLSLLFLLFSCGAKEEDVDTVVDNSIFFDIAYTTQGSRVDGVTSYTRVEGTQELLFITDSGENDVPTNTGKFTVAFQGYREPQLFNTSLCSGGYEGTFSMRRTVNEGEGDPEDPDAPYNPQDPYNEGVPETPEEVPDAEQEVFTFIFEMTVTRRSLSSGCNAISPLNEFSLRIVRFPNGDLYVKNPSRGLEFYMFPKLR